MFFPFSDYATATIGSSQTNVLKYTVPYKCMIIVQITQMERNSKSFYLYTPINGDQSRRDYFISNNSIANTYGFGSTKILNAGDTIWGELDLSPFAATLHLFRLQ
tara:strand:- start:284 stop:598 length:315 start_codon:yes stop_codon:yes gene_type:complete